jgi:hypothetical protein
VAAFIRTLTSDGAAAGEIGVYVREAGLVGRARAAVEVASHRARVNIPRQSRGL